MGFALGASDYLTKPIDRERLVGVSAAIRHAARSAPVLVVDDDADGARRCCGGLLETEGWTVIEAENGRERARAPRARTAGR